ncbi:uncharacterized protein ARMOST_13676 [Armillaria ostoyae]|uniref:Uncharacterized protein n=1 Tax=Armillaria ostoyae TaxID=47428 RepID=A0A284RNE1_ARMOS|nr:uncharacterized protein ARMOST_13676 [Armillaria ostoyae]
MSEFILSKDPAKNLLTCASVYFVNHSQGSKNSIGTVGSGLISILRIFIRQRHSLRFYVPTASPVDEGGCELTA